MKKSTRMLLRRKQLLFLEKADYQSIKPITAVGESQSAYLLCFLKNIEDLGYTLSKDVISMIIANYSNDDIGQLYLEVIPVLQEIVGADKRYKPMYPGFPERVANAPYWELFINAILHYITYGVWMPDESYESEPRLPLVENTKLKVIGLGTESDIKNVAKNILKSPTSISTQDEADLIDILDEYDINIDADSIVLRENAALVGKILIDNSKNDNPALMKTLYSLCKTSTDVLRLAVAMCDGDRSLASNTKFVNFKRYRRRIILGCLEHVITDVKAAKGDVITSIYNDITVERIPDLNKFNQVLADMNKHRQKWLRLAEVLHSREYMNGPKSQYYYACSAIQIIRAGAVPESYGHKVEKYYFTRNFNELIDLLKQRPGEFGRRLDSIIREIYTLKDSSKSKEYSTKLITTYEKIASQISTTELLQILAHFKNRLDFNDDMRVFFPKGNMQKYYLIENNLTDIPRRDVLAIVSATKNALTKQYSSRSALGNVYLSPTMKQYIVPYSQRSASATHRPVTRGSRFPINENATCVRAFVWWTNMDVSKRDKIARCNDRVDIDLSAKILNEDFIETGNIWYGRLRDGKMGYHSGDITNGGPFNGDGVSEFLDINIDAVLQEGGRYVAYTIHSYTNQPFSDLEHLRFGWMEREMPNSGEIYEPKTVTMSMDVSNDMTSCIPVLFDCVERQFIWADLPTQAVGNPLRINNINTTAKSTNYALKATLFSGKTDMYTVVELNAAARGRLTDDRSLADVIFEPDYETAEHEPLDERIKVYSPYDVDFFMGDLL